MGLEVEIMDNDILDLCRLNLMEENILESSAVDRDSTLAAIDFKRRQLMNRISEDTKPATTEVLERHAAQQEQS